jgi:hypothetical protein
LYVEQPISELDQRSPIVKSFLIGYGHASTDCAPHSLHLVANTWCPAGHVIPRPKAETTSVAVVMISVTATVRILTNRCLSVLKLMRRSWYDSIQQLWDELDSASYRRYHLPTRRGKASSYLDINDMKHLGSAPRPSFQNTCTLFDETQELRIVFEGASHFHIDKGNVFLAGPS